MQQKQRSVKALASRQVPMSSSVVVPDLQPDVTQAHQWIVRLANPRVLGLVGVLFMLLSVNVVLFLYCSVRVKDLEFFNVFIRGN